MKWNSKEPVKQQVKSAAMGSGSIRRSDVFYSPTWDVKRSVTEALERVTWVFRCVDAIASNQAKLPMRLRADDRFSGAFVESHPLYNILNSKANAGEPAVYFRYRLSSQFLLSRKGVFIHVTKSNGGDILELNLLNPDQVTIEPHPRDFVKSYIYTSSQDNGGYRQKTIQKFKPEEIVWIRRPHPFDPYLGMTPLESAGLAVETAWLAKLYNRNFLMNDGRPGGIVVVKGDIDESDAEELRARFSGGVGKAGRITVIASEQGADFVDTALTPRDAQYQETAASTKEEILIAFGVPESVLANAAGKSFDNAEQERLIFWNETMQAHLEFLAAPMDVLDGDETTYVAFDTSPVDVLQRAEMKRREFKLREWDAGVVSVNEYRVDTGKNEILSDHGSVMFVPKTKVPYTTTDGSPLPGQLMDLHLPRGRPAETGVTEQDPDQRVQEDDERLAPLDNTDNSAPAAQLSEDPDLNIKTENVRNASDYQALADESVLSRERWAHLAKREVERIAERMGRVLGEKISGHKFKKAFWDSDDPTSKLFDTSVWVKQLNDDLLAVQRSAYIDGYESVGGEKAGELELSIAASHHISTITSRFKDAVAEIVEELHDHEDFRRATTDVKTKLAETAENMGFSDFYPLVSDVYNKGVVEACVSQGFRKMWWEDGNDLHLVDIDANDLFIVGRTSYKFPPARDGKTAILAVKDE